MSPARHPPSQRELRRLGADHRYVEPSTPLYEEGPTQRFLTHFGLLVAVAIDGGGAGVGECLAAAN
jgi:hypothetical protein